MNQRPKISRRDFMRVSSGVVLGSTLLSQSVWAEALEVDRKTIPMGPASRYTPVVHAAFVRRKGDYGILWPGAIYDGEAALKSYTERLVAAAKKTGVKLNLRPVPLYSLEESNAWIAQGKAEGADGLMTLLLDRQKHAWPTVAKASESGVPTVVYAPLGAAFTTNTAPLAKKKGVWIASSDDFSQALFGLKMLKAGAKLRETRFVVLEGNQKRDETVRHFGTKLRYIPASAFLEEYERTPVTPQVKRMAQAYIHSAKAIRGPTEQDVINGIKSYIVARDFLEREEADGITMDCLGALGGTKVSLPCIAWSRMLDDGVPAACEADIGAALTHALVQYLFDRPGFQQDPVADTAKDCLIGAHCTCPTRLKGFDAPPEPYVLSYHHGKRDAVPVPAWRAGQRITVADIVPGDSGETPPEMIISTGTVVGNMSVPPSGGCVVSVMVKLENVSDPLDYPGFHQIFFYGGYEKELKGYCQLFGIKPNVI